MGLKSRQRLGQYRVRKRLASGGFAEVFTATDTIEGIDVALKVPHDYLLTRGVLQDFRREAKLTASLDHPNILPIKTATEIDGHFIIVTRLGIETLADRMTRRMARRTVLQFAEHLLDALACAHSKGIIHCDLKPENLIVFPDNHLRLADFGIARVARKTVKASGSGTVGYMAPEQAMGTTSYRSDVFSTGLLIYRMACGKLPEWPFRWPMPGHEKLLRSYHRDFHAFLRRALQVDEKKRFANAVTMRDAFAKLKKRAILESGRVQGA